MNQHQVSCGSARARKRAGESESDQAAADDLSASQLLRCAAFAGPLFLVGTSRADSIHNSFGLVAPHSTISFSEHVLPDSTEMSTQYADLGVTFGNDSFFYNETGSGSWDGLPGIDGDHLSSLFAPITPVSFSFTQDLAGVAFALATNPGLSTFVAKLDGIVVESFTAATAADSPDAYYGFQNVVLDEIVFSPGGQGAAFVFDNLQLGAPAVAPVPLPAAAWAGLALMGLMGGKGAWHRHKRTSPT